MDTAANEARRGAADWLVLVGRFAALVYLNVLVWLSVWVLIPTLFMGWQPMAIDSGSMGPSIMAGDVVLVEPYEGQAIEAGRVVTFSDPADPSRLVTHRVTAVNDDGTYATKGDANADADSTPLQPEQIQGVGRLVVPRVGIPVVWLAQRAYAPLGAWAVSVILALVLLAPSKPSEPVPVGVSAQGRRRLTFGLRRADTAASGGAPVGFADGPTLQPAAPPAFGPSVRNPLPLPPSASSPPAFVGFTPPSLPLPPLPPAPSGAQAWAGASQTAGDAGALYALVPAVRYRIRLPKPPTPLLLPAPPRWTVSLVPPAPGTAPVAPIPPPPRPAAVRRGSALSTRDVPGWSGRLHSLLLVLALVSGLAVAGTASAPPASAAFSSVHHRIVSNSGNSFTSDQLTAPWNPTITAPIAACRLVVGWSESSTAWRTGYRVYRAINGGAYSALAVVGANAISYQDNTATNPANTYSYRVVAYLTGTWESAATAPVSASPSLAACSAG